MADNLIQLEQDVETFIDPNGNVGSILAQNHQDILKGVLNKVGKYVGSPYLATKNETNLQAGLMSWRGNAMNNTNEFQIDFAKLTADLNDFGLVLSTLSEGDLIHFKDSKGRSVFLEFIGYASANNGGVEVYEVDVKGKADNINYVYQDNERLVCVIEMFSAYSKNNTSLKNSYNRVILNEADSQNTRNDQSSMVRLFNGDLAVAYSRFGVNSNDTNSSEIYLQKSKDNGLNWSDPEILIPQIENGSYIPSLYVKKDGTVLCLFFVRHSIVQPYTSSIRQILFDDEMENIINQESTILPDNNYKPIASDRIYYDEENENLIFPFPELQSGTGNSTISLYYSKILFSNNEGVNWQSSNLEIQGFTNNDGFGGSVEPGAYKYKDKIVIYSRNLVGQIGASNIVWNGTDYEKEGSEYKLKIQAQNAQSSIKYVPEIRGWISCYTRLENDPVGSRNQIDLAYSSDGVRWNKIYTIDDATQLGSGIINEPNIHFSNGFIFVAYSVGLVPSRYGLRLLSFPLIFINGDINGVVDNYFVNPLKDNAITDENNYVLKSDFNSDSFSSISRSNIFIEDDSELMFEKTFYSKISFQTIKNISSSVKKLFFRSLSNFSPQTIVDGVNVKGILSKIDLTSMGFNTVKNGATIENYIALRIQRLFSFNYNPDNIFQKAFAIYQEGEDDISVFMGKIGFKKENPESEIDVDGTITSDNIVVKTKLGVGTNAPFYKSVVEGLGTVVHQIKSTDSGVSAIFFGDAQNNAVGRIEYNHGSDYMRIIVGSSEVFRFNTNELTTSRTIESDGLISKSPDGTRWKLTPDNSGQTVWTQL